MKGNKVYILGGAQSDFERNYTKEGKNVIALLREVMNDALKETNITYDNLVKYNNENKIGCFVGNFIGEEYIQQGHLGALLTEVDKAFYGIPSARYEAACASSSVAIDAAMTKIQVGELDVAIVIGFELMKTVDSKKCGDILGRAAFYKNEGKGIEFPFPKLFGRLADNIIDKYNINQEEFLDSLALISVKNYENAKRNPLAQTRKWYMDLEQASTRGNPTNSIVGGKLGISDCSQITDGAVVTVLVSENYLKEKKIKRPLIKGYGCRVAPMSFDSKMNDANNSEYILPWTKIAIDDAYKRSGLTVDDIDFFETHDCFTSSEFAAISAFGICKPGEEIEILKNKVTSFNGKKPINPSGGLIGCGHPVGASGARMLLDLYKQTNKVAGNYQLTKSENGMMLNIGGSATTNYVYIVGNE